MAAQCSYPRCRRLVAGGNHSIAKAQARSVLISSASRCADQRFPVGGHTTTCQDTGRCGSGCDLCMHCGAMDVSGEQSRQVNAADRRHLAQARARRADRLVSPPDRVVLRRSNVLMRSWAELRESTVKKYAYRPISQSISKHAVHIHRGAVLGRRRYICALDGFG